MKINDHAINVAATTAAGAITIVISGLGVMLADKIVPQKTTGGKIANLLIASAGTGYGLRLLAAASGKKLPA